MDLQFLQDRQEANVFSNYFADPSVHIDLGLPAILAQGNHHPRKKSNRKLELYVKSPSQIEFLIKTTYIF